MKALALTLTLLAFEGRGLIENPVCHPMQGIDCSKLPKESAWFCRCAPPPAPKEMRALNGESL